MEKTGANPTLSKVEHRFHPLIEQWFHETVGSPSAVQERAWSEIGAGNHVLITAPTGSGKTLAAFLSALDRLLTRRLEPGALHVLYVSPLKALNNDVQRNLLTPLAALQSRFEAEGIDVPAIRVVTRSADTPSDERHRMLRHPPEILITTPESLNILLTSKGGRELLRTVSTVILDEIHAVIGSKRGTHLISAVDRLVPHCGEFQRIALSATVKPLATAADFVGGYRRNGTEYEKRTVTIVRSDRTKRYEVAVRFPEHADEKREDGSLWPVLVRDFKKIIYANRSTLFFSNSRGTTEKVTRLLNEGETEQIAYSHHGSLSKEIRLAVEQKLKHGELRSIVATSSLELGIDIGDLNEVILIQSPFSISSGIQRAGRSGHRLDETSRAAIYPTHVKDCINGAVMARAIVDGDIEEIKPIESPLDILAQIILSMAIGGITDPDELYAVLKTSYPYRNLPERDYRLVLEMLSGRYADSRIRELKPRISIDKLENRIEVKQSRAYLLYTSGGTIPDRGYYDLRIQESHAKIGQLDEEFVWERSLGETFAFGTQVWRIAKITHNDVEVNAARDVVNIIPFWKAEEQYRDFHYSEKIGKFLTLLDEKRNDPGLIDELTADYCMEPEAARELQTFLDRQREATGARLPHRYHIVFEHFDDPLNRSDRKQVILHTFWGGKLNQPFAMALAAAWEERYDRPLEIVANNDAILCMLPHELTAHDVFTLVTPENLETLLRKRLEQTGMFGARFRENAARALLLPTGGFKKRIPLWLNRLRAKKLMQSVLPYDDFPILLETFRSCFQDEFDPANLKLILDEIAEGKIEISEVTTRTASPFAGDLIWRQTNKHMYEDDTPTGGKRSNLQEELIRELVFASHLRPGIPEAMIRLFDAKVKRTADGYAPSSSTELLDWIKERLLIPEPEWHDLLKAVKRDGGIEPETIREELKEKIVWLFDENDSPRFIVAIEMIGWITAALSPHTDALRHTPVVEGDPSLEQTVANHTEAMLRERREIDESHENGESRSTLYPFLLQWLSYYGPIAPPIRLPALNETELRRTLEELVEENRILIEPIRENSTLVEICHAENLEILLRMTRKSRRPEFEPLDTEKLPLFLAYHQKLALSYGDAKPRSREDDEEELKEVLDRLFGYPAAVAAWEEAIFPARMAPYYTAWLDRLLHEGNPVWFGCGKKKITFSFFEEFDLFREPTEPDDDEPVKSLLPDPNGRYPFFEITRFSQLETARISELLWDGAWSGKVANDSYESLRRGVQNRFKPDPVDRGRTPGRTGFRRWQMSRPSSGNWFSLPDVERHDPLEKEELVKERVRQLFRRYGVLFRELVAGELPLLQWRSLFRTLRLMEFSGEIVSGYFFKGVPGIQFASHEALRRLGQGLSEEAVYWINATDPASLCGIALEAIKTKLPARLPVHFVVYHGSKPVLVVKRNGKELLIDAEPDAPRYRDYLAIFRVLLSRDFRPLPKIVIETINGEPANESPHAPRFLEFGFKQGYSGLEIWKSDTYRHET